MLSIKRQNVDVTTDTWNINPNWILKTGMKKGKTKGGSAKDSPLGGSLVSLGGSLVIH